MSTKHTTNTTRHRTNHPGTPARAGAHERRLAYESAAGIAISLGLLALGAGRAAVIAAGLSAAVLAVCLLPARTDRS